MEASSLAVDKPMPCVLPHTTAVMFVKSRFMAPKIKNWGKPRKHLFSYLLEDNCVNMIFRPVVIVFAVFLFACNAQKEELHEKSEMAEESERHMIEFTHYGYPHSMFSPS